MSRRDLDAYTTPNWQTRTLLAHQRIDGLILDPCAGSGSIARLFSRGVAMNDIDARYNTSYIFDARNPSLYDQVEQDCESPIDWVVTNPPYHMPECRDIVALAIARAQVGVAMLLRLSFLEPTYKKHPRGKLLDAHAPSRLLILPRHSYTENGQADIMTTAWMVWFTNPAAWHTLPPIVCAYKADEIFRDVVERKRA